MDTYKDAVQLNDLWEGHDHPGRSGTGQAGLRKELRPRRANHRAVKPTGTSALTLSAEIRARFDEFSRSQKDVGQYIVDHLDEASFHTAEELRAPREHLELDRRALRPGARLRGVPRASGLRPRRVPPRPRGRERRRRPRATRRCSRSTRPSSRPRWPRTTSNVEETARKLDRDEVEAAVELISRAERIVLCGTDQMAFFASYLRHLLMLLDLRCEVVASPSQEGLARLGRIDEHTVLSASPPAGRIRSSSAR